MSNFSDILDRIATANHGVQQVDKLLEACENEIRGLRKSVESEHSYSRSLEAGLAKFNDLCTLRAAWREEAMAWRRLADGNGTREEADNARAITNRIFATTPEPAGSTFEMPERDRIPTPRSPQ